MFFCDHPTIAPHLHFFWELAGTELLLLKRVEEVNQTKSQTQSLVLAPVHNHSTVNLAKGKTKALFFLLGPGSIAILHCLSLSTNCAVRLIMFLVRAHPEELLLSSHLPLQSSPLHNAAVTIFTGKSMSSDIHCFNIWDYLPTLQGIPWFPLFSSENS